MINFKNKSVNAIDMYSDNINIYSKIADAHAKVMNAFDNINLLYGESSVSEDIALNSFLSIFNTAKSVTNKNIKNTVNESFLSQEYVDQDFPIDKPLNIDTQNGDITLPIISTNDIEVSNIIIEDDSNGYESDIDDNNMNTILTKNSSSLFQYEKMSNSLSLSNLYLSFTLKTKQADIANGIYIRFYADDNTKYPVIEVLECSIDGEVWNEIPFSLMLNKADYFIRFQPQQIRYIRIRLSQSTYQSIETGFGSRYKYLIGLREVTIKQTIYDTFGEYMSIPFTSRGSISEVLFNKTDSGNIKYLISANNGTKLIEVKDGATIKMYNKAMGVRENKDIDAVRIKIVIDKTSTPMSTIKGREFLSLSSSGSYYLGNIPKEINAYVGQHISYGDLHPYIVSMEDIINTPSIFEDGEIKSMTNLYYIPFYSGIINDISLLFNGSKLKNDRDIYDIIAHQDSKHSVLIIKNTTLINSGTVSVIFNPISSSLQNIELPQKSFLLTNEGIVISRTLNGNIINLKQNDFEVIDTYDKTIIKIKDTAYSTEAVYNILYYPAVDISNSIPALSNSNEIIIKSLKNIPNLEICFEYTYEDESKVNLLKYYTPIGNEYQLELK